MSPVLERWVAIASGGALVVIGYFVFREGHTEVAIVSWLGAAANLAWGLWQFHRGPSEPAVIGPNSPTSERSYRTRTGALRVWCLFVAAVPLLAYTVASLGLHPVAMGVVIAPALLGYLVVRDDVWHWAEETDTTMILPCFWYPSLAKWAARGMPWGQGAFRLAQATLTTVGFGAWLLTTAVSMALGRSL